MKSKKGVRGAVSVFLVMILVPCIVVSSVFVDLGRVHMSKSMATSAGDLALNSLLTNYDADLNEWYGLVASCQSIDEFYEISAQYFLRTISSQGLSDDEIILLSDYYANATNDDTIYDLLQIECQTAPSDMITAVDGANLSNATLMKDQIVEFMKYRAPIEIVSGIINRLNSDTTAGNAVEAEENSQLVEDKQDFYAAEGELTEASYYSYVAIHKYFQSSTGLTNEKLSSYYAELLEYKTAYYEILASVIANLSNTSGLSTYSRYTISLTYYNDYYSNPSKQFKDVYSEKKTEDDVTTYYIDIDDVETLVENLNTKIEAFNTAKTNFNSAAQPVLDKLPYGSGDNQANAVQWWVQMNKAINSSSGHTSKISTAAKEMLQAYSKVLAIDECTLRGDIPTGWDSLDDWKDELGVTEKLSDVQSLQSKYLTAGVSNSNDTYLKAVTELENVSSSKINSINANNLYITVGGQSKNLPSALTYISQQLNNRKAEIQGYIDLLDIAINGDGGNTPSLDQLKQNARKYDSTLGEWSTTAQNTHTTLAGQDEEEISTISELEIDEAAVTELKTRLVNIRSQLQDLIDTIDSLKFGGEAIANITSVDTFKSKASVNTSSIGLTNGEINSYANTLLGQKFTPDTIPTMKHENDSKYNLQINPETGAVDTPDLYEYFHSVYKNTPKDQMDKAKSEKETAKETASNAESDAKDADRYSGGGADVPWEFSNNTSYSAIEGLSGLIGVVKDLINLDFSNMRDDLYVTTYIMEMFSYGTFENEGLYKLLGETDPDKLTELTLGNYTGENYYGSVKGSSPDDEKSWMSKDPQVTQNKTLTNKLINKTNNQAYGAEVEYILYGSKGSTNVDNVKAAYSNIYVIRYGLNVVSGFQHFWNPLGTKSDATATALYMAGLGVQTATAGIVPIAVTEAVLIPILTIFETSKDLDRLQAGFPVELYKSEPGMWWVSLSGSTGGGIGAFMTALSNGELLGGKNNTNNGLFYSDYLTLFVYLGLNSSAQEGMYQRIAEVIQFNIGKQVPADAGVEKYSLKKSIVYFQLQATVRVKPLMITLPIFNDYENNMSTSTDWCTYTINIRRGYS